MRVQATVLACSRPAAQGVPLARWSAAEIVRRLVGLRVVAAIAVSTVSRWLREDKIRPWRYHNWQHIFDPQEFLERARPILRLYETAQDLLRTGVWLVCTDEKTSIQARRREQATVAPGPDQAGQISPRYTRQGAWQLFGALSVADGLIYGQCQLRKRFAEFRTFVHEVLVPEALRRGVHTLALILDNGSTHAPKRLEGWLAELMATLGGRLTIQVYWLPRNASWLDQIEIWFSILQRKLLHPNDFDSLDNLEQAILAFIQHYNQVAKPIHWSYTVEKLEQKLAAN